MNYLVELVEGMIEVFLVFLVTVVVNGFTAVKLPGLNWEPLLTYVAISVIVSIVINFAKGWLLPWNAIANLSGMITMLLLSIAVFWSIAPDAVIEIIVYIIAAVVGIYFGVRFRGGGQSQEQYYY